ncbi:MAG TPA: response regulator [Gemmatimonadaceae bacterium]
MPIPISAQASLGPATDEWVAIIDDHESMRSSLARAFRFEGIRAEIFASAEAFLNRAIPTAPCCLVLDMQLPGMRGHELTHYLERERPPLPPTIFITAHEDLLASLDGCCVAHGRLRKPFEIDALLALVKPLLGN